MLVLSRKLHESIVINGNVRVLILGFDHEKIKLGIEAPREVTVNRFEVETRK